MTSLAETAVVAELETASSVAVPTLEIKDLTVCYTRDRSSARVLDHVSLKIMPGEAYGLVGESGSGKSTLAFSTVSYLAPNAVIESGEILFQGRNMLALDEANLRSLRGSSIAMVYQDPSSALNPTMRVGDQIAEVFEAHEKSSRVDAIAKAIETLRRVAFVNAEAIYERMPHQLSGGQQQRVVIAMALAGNPSLLVLDEPTTGLDLSVQAEVLRLVHSLHKENGMAMLFISHDLATVRRLCDRIGVMRHGVLLEEAESEKLFIAPEHPYTRGLLDCLPREGMHKNSIRLRPIDEVPPVAIELTAEQEAAAAAARCDVVTRDGVPVVELRNITKSFGTVVATNSVNLTIHRGETLGLVGESGSGRAPSGACSSDSSLPIPGRSCSTAPRSRARSSTAVAPTSARCRWCSSVRTPR